jgi:O-antigen/teichoic acid export membrane protein
MSYRNAIKGNKHFFKDEDDVSAIAFLGWIIAILFGLLITLIFTFFAGPISQILKLQEIPRGWLYCIGFIVALIGMETILNSASTQIPVIIITSIYSPAVAGYYSLSHRILNLPMALIGQSVTQVFLDRAAKARKAPSELARITVNIYKRLLLTRAICSLY